MSEHEPRRESHHEDEALIAAFREHGRTPETEAQLLSWTLAREAEVEAENTSHAGLLFNVRRALVYEASGFVEAALEGFHDALLQAEQEDAAEVVAECVEAIQRLSSS